MSIATEKQILRIGHMLEQIDGLELRLLFTTAQNDLPALEAALKRQLALLQGSDT